MKKVGIRSLIKKLDKVYSDYKRSKDNWTCITCGKKGDKHNIDLGHYIKRQVLATRWLESNTHAQCKACNNWGNGEPDIFRRKLVEIYGVDEVERIEQLRFTTLKPTRSELEDLIEHYGG